MNSLISWIGGKNCLKKEIIKNFPAYHERYVEVFGGAGWVLFYKEKSKYETYNDLNSNLFNLFRVVQTKLDEFLAGAEFCQSSREYFKLYKENYNNIALSDVERAVFFYYLVKTSFGSAMRAYNGKSKTQNRLKALENLREINKRLSNVSIENLDFEDCIKRYDKESTFFYCDPPYFGCEEIYKNVPNMEHERLFNILKNIKGKFLLSYNNNDYIKEMYKDFNIIEVERGNNLVSRHKKREIYKELLIKNY